MAENANLTNDELLNWSMNQLFRAARTLDLLVRKENNLVGQACDMTATCILRRMIQTPEGYALVKATNPKLLRGYKKPK